jgi:hypothetical protein
VRSYRDLWLWLGAAMLAVSAGLLAIALAYFTKESSFSLFTSWQFISASSVCILAFIFFFGAVAHWAPRPGFPRIKVTMTGASFAGLNPAKAGEPPKLPSRVSYKVNITNLEREQNANLTIGLRLVPPPGASGDPEEVFGMQVEPASVDLSMTPNPLPNMLDLAPGSTISGDLVFDILDGFPSQRISWSSMARKPRLVFRDHISGAMMATKPFTPNYNFMTADMQPYQFPASNPPPGQRAP